MKERITAAVAGVVTLGTMLWSPLGGWVEAAGGQGAIVAAVFAVYGVIHGLVHYGHGKVAGTMVVLALMLPAPVMAQTPDPVPDRGGLLLAYNLTSLEVGMDRASGWTFEGDLRIPPVPVISIAAHISATNTSPGWTFAGIGPRATWDAGPVKLFAHWLLGSVKVGAVARPGLDHKGGGGLMIPLGRRWELQLGGDHDGDYAHGRLGVGWRF